jgi:hypothetical protein
MRRLLIWCLVVWPLLVMDRLLLLLLLLLIWRLVLLLEVGWLLLWRLLMGLLLLMMMMMMVQWLLLLCMQDRRPLYLPLLRWPSMCMLLNYQAWLWLHSHRLLWRLQLLLRGAFRTAVRRAPLPYTTTPLARRMG